MTNMGTQKSQTGDELNQEIEHDDINSTGGGVVYEDGVFIEIEDMPTLSTSRDVTVEGADVGLIQRIIYRGEVVTGVDDWILFRDVTITYESASGTLIIHDNE